MKETINAYIFDFDGTLADTEGFHFDVYKRLLKARYGVDLDWPHWLHYIGRTDPDFHRMMEKDYGIAIDSPSVMAEYFAILLSFCPKFSAVIAVMPAATIGGVSLVLYGMISAVGVRNIVENQVDFTESRNMIIAAVILVLAIGIKYGAGDAVPLGFTSLSGLAVAALAGILLNAILPGNKYEFGKNRRGEIAVNFGGDHKQEMEMNKE